ncbi:hypothetical protein K469DRAFT_542703, partial [Zopfia rhizophila CBS 207.26]
GAKSIIIILYQVLTRHVSRFRKWASPKAYAILNVIEQVAWGAVAFLGIQANMKSCSGTGCVLSWVVVVLAIILSMVSTLTAFITISDYRYFR